MTIEFRCAQCNQLLRVPDASAGKNARCPKCQLLMQIPATGPANVPPPPPSHFAPPPLQPFGQPPPSPYAPSPYAPQQYAPPPPPPPSGPANPFDFTSGSRQKGNSLGGSSRSGVHQSGDFFAGQPGLPPPPPSNPFDFGSSASSSGSYATTRSGAKTTTSKTGRVGLPWEKGRKNGLEAFIDTVKLVAFDPSKAFSMMLQRGDMAGPMLYSGIGLAIGMLGMQVWNMLSVLMFASSLGIPAELIGAVMTWMFMSAIGYIVVGVPMAATLGNLIGGGILHICLMVCGGSKHGFDTSFRIACYVQSSLMWLCWIPGGVMVLGIWSIVCTIFAVHKGHEVPMGRAVLTVLLPLIVAVVLVIILFVIFGATMVALLSQGRR